MLSITYAQLTDTLWLGSYPQQPEDVLHLRSIGCDAVLNVQTDEDLADRAVQWARFWNFYVSRGIEVVRVPIRDFDEKDLGVRLESAVEALQALQQRGRRVYLHCTAGLNRSPTVAIGWLHRYGGLDLAAATAFVQERRPCVPNQEVLARWAHRR